MPGHDQLNCKLKMAYFKLNRFLLFLLPVLIVYMGGSFFLVHLFAKQEVAKIKYEEFCALKAQTIVLEEKLISAARNIGGTLSHLDHHLGNLDRVSNLPDLLSEFVVDNLAQTRVFSQIRFSGLKGKQITWTYNIDSEPVPAPEFQIQSETVRPFLGEAVGKLRKNEFLITISNQIEGQEGSKATLKPMMYLATPLYGARGNKSGILLFGLDESYLYSWAELDSHGSLVFLKSKQGAWVRELIPQGKWDFIAKKAKQTINPDFKAALWPASNREAAGRPLGPDYLVSSEIIHDEVRHRHVLSSMPPDAPLSISMDNLTLLITASKFSEKKVAAVKSLYRTHLFYILYMAVLVIVASFIFHLNYEKKKALGQKLRQSKDELEKVFNNSLPMCITNPDYEIILKNEAYDRAFPSNVSGSQPLKCYESRPGPDCHTEKCSLHKAFRDKKQQVTEIKKKFPDGTTGYYLYTGKILIDSQGQTTGILQSFQDITSRIEAEQELKEAIKKIDLLHGILPMCSYCKKVRDDKGYWKQVESYISDHSNLDFSHGICPDCKGRHFPRFGR